MHVMAYANVNFRYFQFTFWLLLFATYSRIYSPDFYTSRDPNFSFKRRPLGVAGPSGPPPPLVAAFLILVVTKVAVRVDGRRHANPPPPDGINPSRMPPTFLRVKKRFNKKYIFRFSRKTSTFQWARGEERTSEMSRTQSVPRHEPSLL